MKHRYQFVGLSKGASTRKHVVRLKLPFMGLFLAIASTALASTTWYVNGVHGSDSNNCMSTQTACKTIGHAISRASSGDSIMVAAATYKENLTIGLSLTVIGSGASTTIIDGRGVGTVVTSPSTSANVKLSNVTIRNGVALSGGGIYNSGELTINNSILSRNSANGDPALGGGIYNNSGRVTINNSIFSGNTASNGLCNSLQRLCAGGGIYNQFGTLAINNSTLNGNSSANGGGILGEGGALTITNSTFSGNSATKFSGGAIEMGVFNSRGTLTISNSTLSGNVVGGGTGGAIASSSGTVTLQNSIVANTPSGTNCLGTMTSKGHNLSSDGSCNFNGPGDLNNTDPMLGPLQSNGGPTQTMALPSGSPAIDAGNPNGCTDARGRLLKTDQRGMPRPDKENTGGCDMGAYERQSD
jgi:predicted outer membrane repeat protein